MSGIIMANPVLTFADSSKGDFSNRLQCSKEHLKNGLEYGIKGTAAGLVTTGATIAAVDPAFTNKVVRVTGSAIGAKVGKVTESISKHTPQGVKDALKNVSEKASNLTSGSTAKKISKFFSDTAKKIKVPKSVKNIKLPGKAKIFGAIAVAGAAAFTYFTAKFYHKKGQIDQKYTDMASIKQHVTNLYNPILK